MNVQQQSGEQVGEQQQVGSLSFLPVLPPLSLCLPPLSLCLPLNCTVVSLLCCFAVQPPAAQAPGTWIIPQGTMPNQAAMPVPTALPGKGSPMGDKKSSEGSGARKRRKQEPKAKKGAAAR